MNNDTYLFTSESVTCGHPDKVADQISDAILDFVLSKDKNSRVACECLVTTNFVLISGEISTTAQISKAQYEQVVRDTIKDIGYDKDEYGFNYKTCDVSIKLDAQSPDIAQGVDKSFDTKLTGAGDNGMMFGYACDESTELIPYTLSISNEMCSQLERLRKDSIIKWLRPDGKVQVTMEYSRDNKPLRIKTIVLNAQHDEFYNGEILEHSEIYETLLEKCIIPSIPTKFIKDVTEGDVEILINPTGKFVIGGAMGDTGLTGRKIIVDTYGGWGRHGGGAFSGKDPTKVDRSGAYMARFIAKAIVSAGIAERCEIQLSYAIGVSKPISIFVDTFGTSKLTESETRNMGNVINEIFDLTPDGIINFLQLREFNKYSHTAKCGHFGESVMKYNKNKPQQKNGRYKKYPWEDMNRHPLFLSDFQSKSLEN